MRINEGGNALAAIQPTQPPAVASNSAGAFSAIMTAANAAPAEKDNSQPDFTSMTRKEMFDWMNGKIKGGEMSLDDSFGFLGMTVKIPVGAGNGAPLALDDRERVNFVLMTQEGIAGARSRNDDMTRKMLETAMQVMRHDDGSRVDLRT